VPPRAATAADLPVIRDLAAETWWRHYPSIIPDEQIAAMLQGIYAPAALAAGMAAGESFLLAEDPAGGATGFIGYGRELAVFGGAGITKLYVRPAAGGRGIGRALMAAALAALAGAPVVRLRVNRRNVGAINFYFRVGFTIEAWRDDWYDEARYGRSFLLDDFIMARDPGRA
jgi:ribosomal protein S18 acetylase RimI-like enzyme